MRKKAQIRMGETIAILFVFFVLVLFGLIFYSQWQKQSFERQKVEFFSEQSIRQSLLVSYLPELICSQTAGAQIKDCIDMIKFNLTKEKMETERDYYFDIFGFGEVYVEEIYPENRRWVLYNQTPEKISSKISTPITVSLFWPIERKFSFAILQVNKYA